MDRKTEPSLQAALDAFDQIALFTAGLSRDDFAQQRDTQLIVERILIQVGAALTHASQTLPKLEASMPGFSDLIATRDHVVHHYWEVDTNRVWNVAVTRGPEHARYLRARIVG